MKMKVISVQYHRNGITGMPFYAVLFKDEDRTTKVAVSFEWDGRAFESAPIAVLDVADLASGKVDSKYRGDFYEKFVRQAIATATNGERSIPIPCIGTPAHSCDEEGTHVDQQGYTICHACAIERKKDGRASRQLTLAEKRVIRDGGKVAYGS